MPKTDPKITAIESFFAAYGAPTALPDSKVALVTGRSRWLA
jgi:hypothetical protein